MKKVGYGRVSTIAQELDVQIQMLKAEQCDKIYTEKFTGSKMDRPQLKLALSDLEEGDTLVVTKLDRLARNTEEGIKVIKELLERGVRVQVLNMGTIDNSNMGRFIVTILLAVAEMERVTIIERMAEGKAFARQRDDFKEGRPRKFEKDHIEMAMKLLEEHSLKQVSKMTGISTATLSRNKAKRKDLV